MLHRSGDNLLRVASLTLQRSGDLHWRTASILLSRSSELIWPVTGAQSQRSSTDLHWRAASILPPRSSERYRSGELIWQLIGTQSRKSGKDHRWRAASILPPRSSKGWSSHQPDKMVSTKVLRGTNPRLRRRRQMCTVLASSTHRRRGRWSTRCVILSKVTSMNSTVAWMHCHLRSISSDFSSQGNVCTVQRQEADYSDISHSSGTPSPHYESGDVRMYREVMQYGNSTSGRGPEAPRTNMCSESSKRLCRVADPDRRSSPPPGARYGSRGGARQTPGHRGQTSQDNILRTVQVYLFAMLSHYQTS